MELLLHLLNHIFVWIDARLQRPLARAVPSLRNLIADPARTLTDGPIHIGPSRRYGSKLAFGMLMALLGFAILAIVRGLLTDMRRGKQAPHFGDALFLVGCVAVPLIAWIIVRVLFRGATCILTTEGVELRSGQVTVFCPWALFNTRGQPLAFEYHSIGKLDRFVLPVQRAAVPLVELRDGDLVAARGVEVRSRALRFRSGGEAEFTLLYEVSGAELGQLMLTLGRALGQIVPADPAEAAAVPVEVETLVRTEPGDWITVPLTRVAFPARCCDCGSATSTRRPFAAYPPLFRIGRLTLTAADPVWVHVPFCVPCQRANRRRYWRFFLRGMGTGIVLCGLAAVACWPLFGQANPGLGAACSMLWLALGLFLGLLLARHAARRVSTPVQLKDYSPRRRTVDIRFRWHGYADEMLAAMQVAAGH